MSWKKGVVKRNLSRLLLKFSLILVILRFAAPVMVVFNDFIYLQFLSPRYYSAVSELENTRERISEINNQQYDEKNIPVVELSLLDQAKALYESTTRNLRRKLNLEQKMDNLNNATREASRAAIDLIVIFVFQTILLPVLYIWLIWYLLKHVIRRDFDVNSPART
jgi:hypothetical protein